jgi:hypothetical protein
MPPDDDLDSLIAQSKQKLEGGVSDAGDDLDSLIAQSSAKLASAVPNVQEPSWYGSLAHPIDSLKHMFTPLTDEEWKAKVEATKQPGEQMRAEVERIQSSPWELAKFAGRSALGLGGQYAGGALGFSPAAAGASPLVRTGIGAAAGGIQGGTDALAHGASIPEAVGDAVGGALFGGGLDAAHAVASGLGGAAKGAANRKLAERALSPAELNDVRAEGGSAGVKQAGQELRDLGVTKPRGILDFFRGNTPERMSENSLDILNNARTELDRSTKAITQAPARDVAQYTSEYAPDAVTVGQAPVDVSPINTKLHGQANAFDYAKNPDKAKVYRDLAAELTTPTPAREPAPNASFEPVGAESQPRLRKRQGPRAPDNMSSGLPLESGLPETPDPAALSSEPTGPLEFAEPPMSSQAMDNANALDVPPPTGPGEIDTTSHLKRPYETSQSNVSSEPLLDLEPPPSRLQKPGAIDANMSEQPVDTYQGVATKPAGRPLDMPPDNGENLLLTAPDHAISSPYNVDAPPVDQSYWPHPYEISRNEPPMPPQEAGLPPALRTVLEPAPRFKGDAQPSGRLDLDQPRQDIEPDNLLAPTALYPDNPPLPSGEMAPLGMSRRAPIVGPIVHTGTEQGPRPMTGRLALGSTDPLDVSGLSPTSAPMDPGRFPTTPRPMTPADPSTGFTLEQLMAMRRELGNQTRNFVGRPLNKIEGDMGAATRDAWKGAGDALTGALGGHVESGNITPDIVDAYRGANKTFSTIADVNKNLASRTNQDFKTPSGIQGNESFLGGGMKATAGAAQKMTGLNAQYGLGQGLEGAGNVAQAGSDLARMGAGLGWNSSNAHSEIDKAREENPSAPKAAIEQKANDDMKTTLQKAWYNAFDTAKSMFQ